jgi:uncharacterized protein
MTTNVKIVVAGSVGSGKTTCIRTVSDIEPFETEEVATDEVRLVKRTTTVAMDYGRVDLDPETRVHIYGTPGQARFSFMWEILCEGALGVVVLISNSADDPLGELKLYLDKFAGFAEQGALVVGITRNDIGRGPSLFRYRETLREAGMGVPMFVLDSRERGEVIALFKALIYQIDPFASVAAATP